MHAHIHTRRLFGLGIVISENPRYSSDIINIILIIYSDCYGIVERCLIVHTRTVGSVSLREILICKLFIFPGCGKNQIT